MTRPFFKIALAALFFVSGAASLMQQVAWNKVLNQTVGTDSLSVTLVVSIFMLGLGLGGHVGAVVTRRCENSLRVLIAAELGVTLFGFLSVPILRAMPHLSGAITLDTGTAGFAVDFVLNFMVLLVPVVLMGISLPIVVHAFRDYLPPGSAVGYLYAVNIAGATAGAYVAGVFLIGTLGIRATTTVAAALNLAVALGILGLVRRRSRTIDAPPPEADEIQAEGAPANMPLAYAVAFTIGFVALSYELVYFRLLSCYLTSNSYVFPTVLAAYLIQMSVGTMAAGWAIRRKLDRRLIAWIAVVGSIAGVLLILYGHEICFKLYKDDVALRLYLHRSDTARMLTGGLALALVAMVPVCFVSAFFPLVIHDLTRRRSELGSRVGRVYLIQTAGNFLGTLLTGLVLLPAIGSIALLRVLAVLLMIAGFAYGWALHGRSWMPSGTLRRAGVVGAWMTCLASIALYTDNVYFKTPFDRWFPSRVRESKDAVLLIYDVEPGRRGVIMAGAELTAGYQQTDLPTPLWGLDSVIAMRDGAPLREVLVIGLGDGEIPMNIRDLYPEARIEIVEILDALVDELKDRGGPRLRQLIAGSEIHIADGRRFVNKRKGGPRRYDLIRVEVFRPTAAGSGNLFTAEFLADLRDLLAPDGVLSIDAYFPSVKVGLELFNHVVVVDGGDGKSKPSALMSDRDGLDTRRFPELFARTHADLCRRIAGLGDRIPVDVSESAFVLSDRDHLRRLTADITPQRDDRVATEYFITCRVAPDSNPRELFSWSYEPPGRRLSGAVRGP